MSLNTIWHCIDVLATALDGDRTAAEETLDRLERELKQESQRRRDEVRHSMILIVASLSRLEVRMMESDGPPHAA
jgi:hypothetical protein